MKFDDLKGKLPQYDTEVSYRMLTWFETLLAYHQGKSRPHETAERLADLQRDLPKGITDAINTICGEGTAPQLEAQRPALLSFCNYLEEYTGHRDGREGLGTARRATPAYVNAFERGNKIRRMIPDSPRITLERLC